VVLVDVKAVFGAEKLQPQIVGFFFS
jgi:hypothetical protein